MSTLFLSAFHVYVETFQAKVIAIDEVNILCDIMFFYKIGCLCEFDILA
jgi:hypothetical protein